MVCFYNAHDANASTAALFLFGLFNFHARPLLNILTLSSFHSFEPSLHELLETDMFLPATASHPLPVFSGWWPRNATFNSNE
jgi:hypothetical protein